MIWAASSLMTAVLPGVIQSSGSESPSFIKLPFNKGYFECIQKFAACLDYLKIRIEIVRLSFPTDFILCMRFVSDGEDATFYKLIDYRKGCQFVGDSRSVMIIHCDMNQPLFLESQAVCFINEICRSMMKVLSRKNTQMPS